jgi:predicted MFS family arabinose efflux permease
VFAIVTRRYPHDFRRAIITMTFLGGLASTVFLPLSAWLIRDLGWRHALWVLAAMHLLVCVPLHALVLRGARAGTSRPLQGTAPEAHGDAAARRGTLARHLRSTPFLMLGVFVVLMMGVTAAMPAHLVQMLREQGLSEAWVIAVPASIGALQVFGRLLLYFFEHRMDVHRVNRLILCLIPLGLLALLAGGGNVMGGLLFALLYGMGNGMQTIVKGTAMAQYVSREHMPSLNGALGVPTAIARAVAPLALGLMWSAEAGYSHGLWLLLGASIVALLAFLKAQRAALHAPRS